MAPLHHLVLLEKHAPMLVQLMAVAQARPARPLGPGQNLAKHNVSVSSVFVPRGLPSFITAALQCSHHLSMRCVYTLLVETIPQAPYLIIAFIQDILFGLQNAPKAKQDQTWVEMT